MLDREHQFRAMNPRKVIYLMVDHLPKGKEYLTPYLSELEIKSARDWMVENPPSKTGLLRLMIIEKWFITLPTFLILLLLAASLVYTMVTSRSPIIILAAAIGVVASLYFGIRYIRSLALGAQMEKVGRWDQARLQLSSSKADGFERLIEQGEQGHLAPEVSSFLETIAIDERLPTHGEQAWCIRRQERYNAVYAMGRDDESSLRALLKNNS